MRRRCISNIEMHVRQTRGAVAGTASDVAVLATRTLGDARAVNVRQVTLCCSRERRHCARAARAARRYSKIQICDQRP